MMKIMSNLPFQREPTIILTAYYLTAFNNSSTARSNC